MIPHLRQKVGTRISDHRPVWAGVAVGKPDDDRCRHAGRLKSSIHVLKRNRFTRLRSAPPAKPQGLTPPPDGP
jgi:hypothetical protein